MNARLDRKQALLEVRNVSKQYSGYVALSGVSLDIHAGATTGLIGANGAGKTTLFNVVTRIDEPTSGLVRFKGADMAGIRPHALTASGLTRTFQHATLFDSLSIEQNVMLPLLSAHDDIGSIAFGRVGRRGREMRDRARAVLDRLGLDELRAAETHGLPNPTLKRIEIARALVTEPDLLMLDEPAGGLTRSEVTDLTELLLGLQSERTMAMVVIEHNLRFVMELSGFVYVLDHGVMIAEGRPSEVTANPLVIEAYLGGGDGAA